MRVKPNSCIHLHITQENDESDSITFIDVTLEDCFDRISKIIIPKAINNPKQKVNATKLLFREYFYSHGYGRSKTLKIKGLNPTQVKKIIEKSI